MINSLQGQPIGAAIRFLVGCPDPGGTLVLDDGEEVDVTRIPTGLDLRRVTEIRVDEPGDEELVRMDCRRGLVVKVWRHPITIRTPY